MATGNLQSAPSESSSTQRGDSPVADRSDLESNFVANDVSIETLLNALSGQMNRPIVASEKVRKKRITGEFDLAHPRALLRQLSVRMALLDYDDGSAIYLYDNSEIKNAMVSMERATVQNLRTFARATDLYDSRFPIRGADLGGAFYVTGAPIYVNLVTAAARYLDQLNLNNETEKQVVKVVHLQNSFVEDRTYDLRDRQVDIPGMATVLTQIYGGSGNPRILSSAAELQAAPAPAPTAAIANVNTNLNPKVNVPFSMTAALPPPDINSPNAAVPQLAAVDAPSSMALNAADGVRAIAYPGTNSIVLAGPKDKVVNMEVLIDSLDLPKRQIELSLWIIDIKKSCLNELGLNWQGKVAAGRFSVDLNDSRNLTTLDGAQFLASVAGLSQKGDAMVVSRPVLLTQENVKATFDSNQTFYEKLIGERTAQLSHVTYGTMINVLPRLTKDGSQVEMDINVEDGNANSPSGDINARLPLVSRTRINTVARVPSEMSLLIGGNTRDNVTRQDYRIPGLASIPLIGTLFRGHTVQHEQVVRVFLIQPKPLGAGARWSDGQSWESGDMSSNETLRATVHLLRSYMGRQ
ncbi:type III secretion system outer membrane ring subunit SctC [Paraburkholderia youngii]|uniref:type III secretion system outer membrane ring subunit SctC n=1 Tax=Paraburkholderia youngii TaxID=2782701 RepID=UPI003D19EA4D